MINDLIMRVLGGQQRPPEQPSRPRTVADASDYGSWNTQVKGAPMSPQRRAIPMPHLGVTDQERHRVLAPQAPGAGMGGQFAGPNAPPFGMPDPSIVLQALQGARGGPPAPMQREGMMEDFGFGQPQPAPAAMPPAAMPQPPMQDPNISLDMLYGANPFGPGRQAGQRAPGPAAPFHPLMPDQPLQPNFPGMPAPPLPPAQEVPTMPIAPGQGNMPMNPPLPPQRPGHHWIEQDTGWLQPFQGTNAEAAAAAHGKPHFADPNFKPFFRGLLG